MRKRRVLAGSVVLAVAAIAACLGPSLSSTAQEAVVIQQGSSVNIGDVMVGSTGSASITISPAAGSQSSSDTITMITKGTCPGFALQLNPVPPVTVTRSCTGSGSGSEEIPTQQLVETGDTSDAGQVNCTDSVYTFGVTYTPVAAGSASCTITITGSTFSPPLTVVALANGVAPAFAMEVTPKTINFGDVRVGNSGAQPLEIRNTGANPITISPFVITPPFAVTPPNNPIGPGKTEIVTASCSPGSAGQFMANLNVNGGSAGSTAVTLMCRGVMSNLDVTPSPLDVTTRVGEPIEKTIAISNDGGAPAVLTSITIVPTVAGIPVTIVTKPPDGTSLGSGSNTSVRVRFAPTAGQAPAELARLRISHDVGQQRDVVINGAALETAMAVNPDTVDFGAVCAGTTAMQDVDVRAGAAGSFNLASVTPPAAPFTFTAKGGTSLPALAMGNGGNTLEFVASVTPTGDAPSISGTVTLSSDIPGDRNHEIVLRADVLPGGLGASPQTMDFGGVLKSTLSTAMSTEVRNCTEAPLAIDDVHIEGPDAQDFAIVIPGPSELTPTLEPHASLKYHVVVRADRPGAKVGSLVITSGTSVVTVALLATTLGGGDGGQGGERSYYTCGVGDPGGAAAFAVLVLFGLRRRRR